TQRELLHDAAFVLDSKGRRTLGKANGEISRSNRFEPGSGPRLAGGFRFRGLREAAVQGHRDRLVLNDWEHGQSNRVPCERGDYDLHGTAADDDVGGLTANDPAGEHRAGTRTAELFDRFTSRDRL